MSFADIFAAGTCRQHSVEAMSEYELYLGLANCLRGLLNALAEAQDFRRDPLSFAKSCSRLREIIAPQSARRKTNTAGDRECEKHEQFLSALKVLKSEYDRQVSEASRWALSIDRSHGRAVGDVAGLRGQVAADGDRAWNRICLSRSTSACDEAWDHAVAPIERLLSSVGSVTREELLSEYTDGARRDTASPTPPAPNPAIALLTNAFVPSALQNAILEKLDGNAKKSRPLAKQLCISQPKLYVKNGIKELVSQHKVALHKRLGYFRPDAPPDQLKSAVPSIPDQKPIN